MKASNTIIDELKRTASKSILKNKHAAAIIDVHGNIVCKSSNIGKFRKHRRDSIHAEVACVRKFMKAYFPRGVKVSHLVVIRVNNRGELVNSKPCVNCTRMLNDVGLDVLHS